MSSDVIQHIVDIKSAIGDLIRKVETLDLLLRKETVEKEVKLTPP